MNQQGRAIVIGGSMGGLFAANFLWRAGWDVTVFEKSSVALTSRGTGIVTNDGLCELLRRAGASIDHDLGVPLTRRVVYDRQGGQRAERLMSQTMTGWSRLLRLLSDAFPADRYRLGHTIQSVDPGNDVDPARVLLSDGASHQADLVVAADGVRSTIRSLLFDAPEPVRAGYVAWRALVPRSELSARAMQMLGNTFAFEQAPGEQIVGYPVRGDDGIVYLNVVWYRDRPGAELDDLLTDASGRIYPDGIAPSLIRPECIAQARTDARRMLNPIWAEILDQAPEMLLQVIVDGQVGSMARGRVALIGDAAFTARPHIGQGVTKAAGDAWVMCEALARAGAAVVKGLQAFSDRRVPIGQMTVEQARRMGAIVYRDPGDRAPWARHYGIADHVLQDSAVELPGVSGLTATGADSA